MSAQQVPGAQPKVTSHTAPILTIDGLRFRDLNHDGQLERYEDWRLTPADRVNDLLSRMTLEEMAGVMMHGTAPSSGSEGITGRGTEYDLEKARDLIVKKGVNTLITRLTGEPSALARANNSLQEIGEQSRLGIPILLSTDPRSHFQYTFGASVQGGGFSQWPETTGLAAIGDPTLVRRFADIVRQEYRAVGIREALSPQADLATEPRWPRLNGTFGEDADVAKRMVQGYVEGMQAGSQGLNPESGITVVKHWVGYGAQKDGFDSHNFYGRYASFPGNNFAYHVIPFEGAFAAHAAAVMPTYSILQGVSLNGTSLEPVGGGFNKQLLQGLLRDSYHFDGVVLSDWAITKDCGPVCENGTPAGEKPSFATIGMPWGVQVLSKEDRFAKAINAGVDQVGGTEEANFVIDAVRDGKLSKERVREATRRILIQKFQIGLFEDPFVEEALAAKVIGDAAFAAEGVAAQKRAVVLLQNTGKLLPLKDANKRIYVFGLNASVVQRHGFRVASEPTQADMCLIRAATPFDVLHPGYTFGLRQHEGRLDFRKGDPAYDALLSCHGKPVILTVYLDRPAILSNVRPLTTVLLGDFGINDDALLDLVVGKGKAEGHLPFELPSSMSEVQAQQPDLPHDTAHPLYKYGFALPY